MINIHILSMTLIKTNRICPSEIMHDFKGLQNRIFLMQLLVLRARLILRKASLMQTLLSEQMRKFQIGVI